MAPPEEEAVRPRAVPPGPEEIKWLEQGMRNVGFFSRLGREHLGQVLPHMLILEYAAGAKVCVEGEVGDSLYLIQKGRVRISKKGWEKPVATLEEGDFFGEMSLLFGESRSATATALDPAVIFCLSAEDFHRLVKKSSDMTRTLTRLAESRRNELAQS